MTKKRGGGAYRQAGNKSRPDCVNKVHSRAEKDEQRFVYLADATESTVDVYTRWTHFSPIHSNCVKAIQHLQHELFVLFKLAL